MPEEVSNREKLRQAKYPYYVTMTDTFFSGWGQAKGRIAKYIAPASSLEEAEVVAYNAKARGDQKNVNIVSKKPSYNAKRYRVGWMDKANNSSWYKHPVDSRGMSRLTGKIVGVL
jgi:hypothetical protein